MIIFKILILKLIDLDPNRPGLIDNNVLKHCALLKDNNFLQYAGEELVHDQNIIDSLLNCLENSKEKSRHQMQGTCIHCKLNPDMNVSIPALIVTILCAGNFSFSGKKLSNLSLCGANLQGSIITYSLFENVCFKFADLSYSLIFGSKFKNSDFTGTKIRINPTLYHKTTINLITPCLNSINSDDIGVCDNQGNITIYNLNTGENTIFKGVVGLPVYQIKFFKKGEQFLSCGSDKNLIIWSVKDQNQIKKKKMI